MFAKKHNNLSISKPDIFYIRIYLKYIAGSELCGNCLNKL